MSDQGFRDELKDLINKYSKENGSNTPDYALRDFLCGCLRVFEEAVRVREHWHRGSRVEFQKDRERSNERAEMPAGESERDWDAPLPEGMDRLDWAMGRPIGRYEYKLMMASLKFRREIKELWAKTLKRANLNKDGKPVCPACHSINVDVCAHGGRFVSYLECKDCGLCWCPEIPKQERGEP